MLWLLPQLGVPRLVAPKGWTCPCCPSPSQGGAWAEVLGWLGDPGQREHRKGDYSWAWGEVSSLSSLEFKALLLV